MNVKLPLGVNREEVAREVGRRIERRMKKLGMKQADLARATGRSRDSASSWVRGHAIPRRPMLARIAHALGCT